MFDFLMLNNSNFSTLINSSMLAVSVAITANTLPAQAVTGFTFSGSDMGGTGSAEMSFSGLGTRSITVDLWNTSPTTLLDGSNNSNAPAITKFGFNAASDPLPKYSSWTLKAIDSTDNLVTIGDHTQSGLFWSLGSNKVGNLTFDYLAETKDVKGGLYNPDANSGLAAKPNYFTKATLTINFDSAFFLEENSTFVRMQNVGKDGKGSLKLSGVPVEDVPEPLTILGTAMALGFGCCFKKEYTKKYKAKA